MVSVEYMKERCANCCFLEEGNNGEWLCGDCDWEAGIVPCVQVDDDECSAMCGYGWSDEETEN